jgi:hypothetical protein
MILLQIASENPKYFRPVTAASPMTMTLSAEASGRAANYNYSAPPQIRKTAPANVANLQRRHSAAGAIRVGGTLPTVDSL